MSPDSLYVSYVTQADDLDFYALPTPPVGSTIRVYLSHLPADYDLAVYAPADAQLRPEVAGTEPLDSPPLGDEGVPLTTRQDALPPETLDDLRLDTGPAARRACRRTGARRTTSSSRSRVEAPATT